MNEKALERLFAALEWDVLGAEERQVAPGEHTVAASGETVVVSVTSGAFDAPALGVGAIVLWQGREPLRLRAVERSTIRMARLRLVSEDTTLLDGVPDVVTVAAFAEREPGAAALAPHVGLADETTARTPATLCRLMGTTLALAVLRAWVDAGCAPAGWPARASDPHLARVIEAIHSAPADEWTLGRMAAAAMMSRSVFADRFRAETGQTPREYVTGVRMAGARELLSAGAPVGEVASRVGYASEEGFSRAFRRVTGAAPSQWRVAAPQP
ncbi:MAG: AraC family transcriptional regulator [Microbacterium sp.]